MKITTILKKYPGMALMIAAWSVAFLSGAFASGLDPEAGADALATAAGFEKQDVKAGVFTLRCYARIRKPGAPLTVYVEGDGRAWSGKNRRSADPTPLHPVALRLAASDPSENVVYVARPGQYVRGAAGNADPAYWSGRRFSEEVVASLGEAIDWWKSAARSPQIDLVGYSGGGALAVLAADRRTDIRTLRTVAGNLDPAEVNRRHRVTALEAGPDPMEAAKRLAAVPQRHFVGGRDSVVMPGIAERYRAAAGETTCVQITRVEEASHGAGWIERWTDLLALPVDCGY